MRLFWGLIAVMLAAALAALLVLPETARVKDVIPWEPAAEQPEIALKDDSRVPSMAEGGETEPAAAAGGDASSPPELRPILVEQLPFDTACGLFLTPPDSRDVIFMMPETGSGQPSAMAALNVEGQLVMLHRAEALGDPIGNVGFSHQIFRSQDGSMTVVAKITGAPAAEGERVQIPEGELTVMMPGRATLKMPVSGAAGC